ncbi:MAG: cyclic-di-AMP receptor, partial [Eubacteriales bacterium]|nr:cyclic-di-AMP receptor [Eubacteriales bacterium]
MKLVFAIVSDDDSSCLMTELNRAGHRVTKLHSTGGSLKF